MERKILFTASSYSHICSFHLPYLRYFQERGWRVHVACGGEARPIPYADEVIHLPFEKQMRSPANFRAAKLLRAKLKRERYDLITTHTSLAAFFTRLAVLSLRDRSPLVNVAHGYLFDGDTGAAKKQILLTAERMTAPCTDLLLTMNQWDYETARKYRLGKRVVNIPGIGVEFSRLDGVDPALRRTMRAELGLSKEDFVLFYAAEFSKRKSQSVLIEAMKDLPERVVLILAGQGVLLEECRGLVRQLGLEKRVKFPGHVDVAPWYRMADAAVSSSRSEGLPFNIMEAMYCGLPVVASAVKGHTDLIVEGESGLLYPYGDTDACAQAVKRLLEAPVLGEKLGHQAGASMSRYELEQVLPIVTEPYESLLTPAREPVAAR